MRAALPLALCFIAGAMLAMVPGYGIGLLPVAFVAVLDVAVTQKGVE